MREATGEKQGERERAKKGECLERASVNTLPAILSAVTFDFF